MPVFEVLLCKEKKHFSIFQTVVQKDDAAAIHGKSFRLEARISPLFKSLRCLHNLVLTRETIIRDVFKHAVGHVA